MAYRLRTLYYSGIAIIALLQASAAFADGVRVGVVGNAQGTVTAVGADGAQRTLKTGDNIFQNDVIHTAADSRAQMLFLDKSALTLTPGSEVKIDTFVYDPASAKGDMSLQEVKGAFRFIGGALSKQDHVEIQTPVSTIGIRGGIEETHIAPKGDAAEAIFIYGHDMTVTDKGGQQVVLTQFGSGANVQQGLPAPVAMSPSAVEHSLAQFNAATKNSAPVANTITPGATGVGKNNTNSGNGNGGAQGAGGSQNQGSGSGSGTLAGGNGTTPEVGTTAADTGSGGNGAAMDNGASGNSNEPANTASNAPTDNNAIADAASAVQNTTTTSTANTTQTAGQQSYLNAPPAFAYVGPYVIEDPTTTTVYNQGLTHFNLNSTSLNGVFQENSPATGTQLVALPIPGASGFREITAADDVMIGGALFTGAAYAAPDDSMVYYFLQGPGGIQISAVTGTPIAQAKWASAAVATDAAAHAAGSGDVTFYQFLPAISPNAPNANDFANFLQAAAANSGLLNFTQNGSISNPGELSVNWAKNTYVGGGIDWANQKLLITFGNVTPTSSTLMSGTLYDFSTPSQPIGVLNPSPTIPNYQTGSVSTTALVYGPQGNGPITGFIANGVEPNINIYAPVATITGTSAQIASTQNVTSGTLNGYAAGFMIVTAAPGNSGVGTAQAFWTQAPTDVTLTKDATAGQVGATINMTETTNPSNTVSASFGTQNGAASVLVDDKIFGAAQGSVTVNGNQIANPALQSGVLVSADTIANVQHSCSNCDFVQWGIWAGQVNTGTVGAPNTQAAAMIPVVMGVPTNYSDVVNLSTINTLGAVTYTGPVYGQTYNAGNNTLAAQEGTFSSVIDLSNRTLNNFNATLGTTGFGTNTTTALASMTTSTGTGIGFQHVGVSGVGVSGYINGMLYGPNAENVGGNFAITNTGANTNSTGIFLGGRPH